MKYVCGANQCTGCMACVDICPKEAITIHDDIAAFNAVIQEEKCVNCGACYRVCQNNNMVKLQQAQNWYQGWAENVETRSAASSGGLASELMASFVRTGGKVCSCSFKNGKFLFSIESQPANLGKFAGSKYVKSNPNGIYKQIASELRNGKKLMFIGLPCQVAGLKKYITPDLQKNLYTVDMICHGTPSVKVLERFLAQYGYTLKDLHDILFRIKDRRQIAEKYKPIVRNGIMDCYSIAFMYALCYTENCYHCSFAKKERISDITIGDSWGSALDLSEQKKGVSLVLCQTKKGQKLLEQANLHLEDADREQAILYNQQLVMPSRMPKARNMFLEGLKRGKKFNRLVCMAKPSKYFKQLMKRMLMDLHIYKDPSVRAYSIFISVKNVVSSEKNESN